MIKIGFFFQCIEDFFEQLRNLSIIFDFECSKSEIFCRDTAMQRIKIDNVRVFLVSSNKANANIFQSFRPSALDGTGNWNNKPYFQHLTEKSVLKMHFPLVLLFCHR
uniref:(northern house mosquito) hypothetical protein n=1 Tax=Culex pipiens TaxID=7175 RepID=A0A8D8G9A9_CULPI